VRDHQIEVTVVVVLLRM